MHFRLLSLVYYLNWLLAFGSSHLESQSGSLLSTPGMYLAFIMNWCRAASSAISLREFCNSISRLLPVLSTVATASLSTCIQKYFPCTSLAHIFSATMTAHISNIAMFFFLSSLGNLARKYWLLHIPPYPLRHASVCIMVSVPGSFISHMSDMPLNSLANLDHHAMSFLASIGIEYDFALSISLIHWMSLPKNILPALTHFAMNCSFPTSYSTSLLVAAVLSNQVSSSLLISLNFSSEMSIVIVLESKVIPRNSSLVVGDTNFS